jgi:hypothetical protein
VASWQRDRLGYFQASDLNLKKGQGRHVISAPIDLEGQLTQVWLNVDGLSQHAQIAVEILDERFQPIDGYLAQDCQPLESGLRQPVHWKNHQLIMTNKEVIRIRLNYVGLRPEDPKIYAIYVTSASTI